MTDATFQTQAGNIKSSSIWAAELWGTVLIAGRILSSLRFTRRSTDNAALLEAQIRREEARSAANNLMR